MANRMQIALSFDTTGSMYACLTQVRRNAIELVKRLLSAAPGTEIAIIAHGDYNDYYETMQVDFTTNVDALIAFINNAGQTCGFGNGGECYELVLNKAQALRWKDDYAKALVMIGDEPPHTPTFRENRNRLDWQVELQKVRDLGILVYGVQAMNRREANFFWQALGGQTGFHLSLDQFHEVSDLLLAITYKTASDDRLLAFEKEVEAAYRMTRSNEQMFNTLLRRTQITPPSSRSMDGVMKQPSRYGRADKLQAVPPGRFQVLQVDSHRDRVIADFVRENVGSFQVGKSFYEMTKRETIQARKEVILMDRRSGDMFTGEKAREIMGLPPAGQEARIAVPEHVLDKYVIFVQSTSSNRKLIAGTRFLYEVQHDYALA